MWIHRLARGIAKPHGLFQILQPFYTDVQVELQSSISLQPGQGFSSTLRLSSCSRSPWKQVARCHQKLTQISSQAGVPFLIVVLRCTEPDAWWVFLDWKKIIEEYLHYRGLKCQLVHEELSDVPVLWWTTTQTEVEGKVFGFLDTDANILSTVFARHSQWEIAG